MNLKKREAREFCFQFFFHLQLPVFQELRTALTNDQEVTSIIKSSIEEFKESTEIKLAGDQESYVIKTISGTLKNYQDIEKIIMANLKNWKLKRISKVDHTNLLLSCFELRFDTITPKSVVINEAIEISKKYGTKESSSFINGILDNIAKEA